MSDYFFFEFMTASLLMGLAIGLDAAIVTYLRVEAFSTRRKLFYWSSGILFTHTCFPMLGYLLAYYGVKSFPLLSPMIGLIAAYLIFHFLYDELKKNDEENESEFLSMNIVNIALMLAVSWDALWSGPAKSAQVIQWPEPAIWASFLVVGVTVAILLFLAVQISRRVLVRSDGEYQVYLQWLQYSVIAYFGVLALTKYTLAFDIPSFYLMVLSAFVIALILCNSARQKYEVSD